MKKSTIHLFESKSQCRIIECNFFKRDGKVTKIWCLLFHRIWKNIVYYWKVIFISHLRRRPLFAPNFSFRRSSSSYYYSVLNIFILRERKSLVFDSMVSCKPQNGFVTTIAPTLLVVDCATGLVDENFDFEMWLLKKIMSWRFVGKNDCGLLSNEGKGNCHDNSFYFQFWNFDEKNWLADFYHECEGKSIIHVKISVWIIIFLHENLIKNNRDLVWFFQYRLERDICLE